MTILAAIENWLFLVLLAMAAIFRLLTKAAGSRSSPSEPDDSTFPEPDEPRQPSRPSSDEEQIRKFLEALGQPRTAKPPPPVVRRMDIPPRPVAPVRPPQTLIPVPSRRATIEREQIPQAPPQPPAPPPPLPRHYEPKSPRPVVSSAPVFEVHETTEPVAEMPATAKSPTRTAAQIPTADQGIGALLRSEQTVRTAIILREILGPPRGVEPFEFSGTA